MFDEKDVEEIEEKWIFEYVEIGKRKEREVRKRIGMHKAK